MAVGSETGGRGDLGLVIGVACAPSERDVVREFFELFKTPWEFDESTHEYEVLIVTAAAGAAGRGASLTVAVGSKSMTLDEQVGVAPQAGPPSGRIEFAGGSLPLSGPVGTFGGSVEAVARLADGRPAAVRLRTPQGTVIRCGYDLFAEVERLLGEGQDPRNGSSATLDAHIDLLRSWIVSELGVLVEIPPVRHGHPYAVCLTHDVDFLALRMHRWDRTLLGFLYRATIGSLLDALRRRDARRLARNWLSVASLPFVHLDLCRDPWQPFSSYVAADGARSTFFVIPYRGRGGEGLEPAQARRRRVPYDVDDVRDALVELHDDGYEIAVHGIDAWCDTAAGRAELERISSVVGTPDPGVRMHWLLFDARSRERLDAAGYEYDATCGYNDAVGFRAGTTQVFKPLDADHLLELPLHIQDTALFFPGRLHLSDQAAWEATEMVRRAALAGGGVLTVSWHDRSLAPERLWHRFYARLLDALRSDGAWFGTARDVVAWFRLRRGLAVDGLDVGSSGVTVEVRSEDPRAAAAGFVIRVHSASGDERIVVDVPWHGEERIEVQLPASGQLEAARR